MFCSYIIPSNFIIGKIDINIKADEFEGVLIDKGGEAVQRQLFVGMRVWGAH
jgi:hypothetical protein